MSVHARPQPWLGLLAATLLLLQGCTATGPAHPRDPLEGFNRSMHSFNDGLDTVIVQPIARGYKTIAPAPLDKGISNFFSNIDDVLVVVNDVLQGKVRQAFSDAGRLVVNSTIGVLGIFDVANDMGMPKHKEDLGQTLGTWGVDSGPYLVLPFFGPTTLRDSLARFVSTEIDPIYYIEHIPTRLTILGVKFVDFRADLLSASRLLDTASLDEYSFLRDAYLQRREYLIHDGNPPIDMDGLDLGPDGPDLP